ncbi:MAG: phosphoadenylyl-sulfate reductase [Verrucomicrobiales bacterium]|nr:phosphoadenylyl-sulfate reductase [Verrucomicrobiales bacterium]
MTSSTTKPEESGSSLSKPADMAGISDLVAEAVRLEGVSPEERVEWALRYFSGSIALSSSFGAQSAVLLHMVTRQQPDIPVILVDTGYLFSETYHFIDRLTERLNLNLKIYRSEFSPAWQEARWGKLWEQGVEGIEKYNHLNKVEPMRRAQQELGITATIAGIRRQQSSSRERVPVVAGQKGLFKVHPIIDWTDMQVGEYLIANDLPYHPLWDEGYVSIGDWHTSRKLTDGMTAEETRFFGLKRECGLHEEMNHLSDDADFVI